ncbi:MAG: L,D-transpeptidase family protein [Campylobacterales bacterium]|nr:L,D-transpeptidase family protein [Campylobacterales bacterium]
MRIKIVIMATALLLLGSCTRIADSDGWSSGNKSAFMRILHEDKYLSICNQESLYNQVKSSGDSKLLNKLFLAYTNNLANGCIDRNSFKASQRSKTSKEIDTNYKCHLQEVNATAILTQLKNGVSVENILKPYIPTYPEFFALVDRYKLLKAAGKTDANTLRKIRLNIERLKLITPDLGRNYVLINVPEFNVRFVEDKKTAMKFGVVIGKYDKQTPIFSSKLEYIVVNPTWNVPDSIARKTIIPYVRNGSGYLNGRNMVARKCYDLSCASFNPASVDWTPYLKNKKMPIPYKFIQKPSKGNALERVKFMFPNQYSVYMHDTNAKELFKSRTRASRSQSSGCIRLEKPLDMLHHLAAKYTHESPQSVKAKYNSFKTHHIKLKAPISVHTVYLTAFVDDSGELIVSEDLYGFDKSQKLIF